MCVTTLRPGDLIVNPIGNGGANGSPVPEQGEIEVIAALDGDQQRTCRLSYQKPGDSPFALIAVSREDIDALGGKLDKTLLVFRANNVLGFNTAVVEN